MVEVTLHDANLDAPRRAVMRREQCLVEGVILAAHGGIKLLERLSPGLAHAVGALLNLLEACCAALALAHGNFVLEFLQVAARNAELVESLPAEIFQLL